MNISQDLIHLSAATRPSDMEGIYITYLKASARREVIAMSVPIRRQKGSRPDRDYRDRQTSNLQRRRSIRRSKKRIGRERNHCRVFCNLHYIWAGKERSIEAHYGAHRVARLIGNRTDSMNSEIPLFSFDHAYDSK